MGLGVLQTPIGNTFLLYRLGVTTVLRGAWLNIKCAHPYLAGYRGFDNKCYIQNPLPGIPMPETCTQNAMHNLMVSGVQTHVNSLMGCRDPLP